MEIEKMEIEKMEMEDGNGLGEPRGSR